VANEGNAGQRGGPAGDLYVFLSVQSHPTLRRDGINIQSEVTVNYLQAILGDTIEVETVDGPSPLQIPPGTQPGTVLTLSGKGVPKLGNPVARGNHLISLRVQLPTKLSGEERRLLEQLAGHHTAKGQKHPHKSGLFGGLFG
jgi:molecular chaperone DnaJ